MKAKYIIPQISVETITLNIQMMEASEHHDIIISGETDTEYDGKSRNNGWEEL